MFKKITFITLLLMIFLSINGCVLLHGGYVPAFSQGNIITEEELSQLHEGMPASEVISILGSPVLIDTFSDNRLDYVYTFEIHEVINVRKRVIISINNGRVSHILVSGVIQQKAIHAHH